MPNFISGSPSALMGFVHFAREVIFAPMCMSVTEHIRKPGFQMDVQKCFKKFFLTISSRFVC